VTPRRRSTVLLALAMLLGCSTRMPDRVEIPEGFVGWIVVQYAKPECVPLPKANGYYVLRVSARGRICTSDSPTSGEAFDKFDFVRADGTTVEIDQRSLVWGGAVSSTGRRFVFIGTEEQWRNSPDTVSSLDDRCSKDPAC